MNSAAR